MEFNIFLMILLGIIIIQWATVILLLMVEGKKAFDSKKEFLLSWIPYIWVWVGIHRGYTRIMKQYNKL